MVRIPFACACCTCVRSDAMHPQTLLAEIFQSWLQRVHRGEVVSEPRSWPAKPAHARVVSRVMVVRSGGDPVGRAAVVSARCRPEGEGVCTRFIIYLW